jgi:uroporphyrinogen-III synthase
LVTRPKEQDSTFIRLLEERGATVIRLPLLCIGPPPDERALRSAVERIESFDWLAFTSPAGVAGVARLRQNIGGTRPRLAAVGPATARAIEETFGRSVDLVPERYCGEELAAALLARAQRGDSVLVMQAAEAQPALVARLRAAKLNVEAVAAYATLPERPPELEACIARADVITFASPSAVRSLVAALGEGTAAARLRGKPIACIGPVTLREARSAGLQVEILPASATAPSLVEALSSYWGRRQPR